MSAADLVARLAQEGIDPALLAEIAQELFVGEAERKALADRRRNERDRKASQRHGTSRDVTGQHVNGAEFHGNLSPLEPPLKNPPDPEKHTPLKSPQSEDLSASPTDAPLTKKEILEAWHERMVPLGFPAVAKMTAARDRQLAARLKDSTLEEWQRAMDALERSAFCRGENDRGWRADFDFLLQPKSFTKLLEGAYDH